MDKTALPQQLSFNFEESTTGKDIVASFPLVSTAKAEVSRPKVKAMHAVVYDFDAIAKRRRESERASLYRQILASVKHIG